MKTESYNFRKEELEILKNMPFAEYKELKGVLENCEKENSVFYKLLKERIVMGLFFLFSIIISIFLFNFIASGVAILFFIYFLVKTIKVYSEISTNNILMKSLKEDIEYYLNYHHSR